LVLLTTIIIIIAYAAAVCMYMFRLYVQCTVHTIQYTYIVVQVGLGVELGSTRYKYMYVM
jgi:hypothetical protein